MSNILKGVLLEYLKYRKGEKEDYLFCNQKGEQITKSGIESSIAKYNHSRGVEKTSMHVFRHTFAKNWLLNGGDIFKLQKLLGHKSVDMVKQYVEMTNEDLKNNFEEFNPLDKFKGRKQNISMKNR